MNTQFIISSFILIFVYGGLREYFRIKKGYYDWLNKLSQGKKMLYITGRSTYIFTAYWMVHMLFLELSAPQDNWKKVYLYISVVIAEELGSYIFSKIEVKPKEYALAAMIPGTLIIVIIFMLQLPLMFF